VAAADGTGGRRCGRADGIGGQVSEGGRGEVKLKAAQRMARAEGVIYSSPDSRSWQMRPWGNWGWRYISRFGRILYAYLPAY